MEPLVTNKKVLILLCVCPPDKSASVGHKIACILFALVIFILNASVVEVHLSYFSTFFSINLADSLYALMYGIAFFAPVYGMISTLFVRNQFGGIFRELSVIYRASECSSNHCRIMSSEFHVVHSFFQFRRKRFFIPIFGPSQPPKRVDVEVFFLNDDRFNDCHCGHDIGLHYFVLVNEWKYWSWAIVSCIPCYVSQIPPLIEYFIPQMQMHKIDALIYS